MISNSKFELNAVIERLINSNGSDNQARDELSSFASSLLPEGDLRMDVSVDHPGGNFSGHTPQHGNVTVSDNSEQKTEWSFGETMVRVGYFKVSRSICKKAFKPGAIEQRIVITHFWKSDPTTESESESPEAWCLSCNAKMEPVWFGQFASRQLLHFGYLSLYKREIHETWGNHPGSIHSHGLHIGVFVR
jgi:hypothetical protein